MNPNSHVISFSYSSIPPVSKQFRHCYAQYNLLLLSLETWNFNTQESLWARINNWDIYNNLHNIQLNRGLFTWTISLKRWCQTVRYFHGINITLFLNPYLAPENTKKPLVLKKTFTIVCSEMAFSKSSHHIETSKLITLQIIWPVSI